MKLLISPHNDDETLFAAFTIMKERPLVCIVFDSYVQVARGNRRADAITRRMETMVALQYMEIIAAPIFVGLRDDQPDYEYLRTWLKERRDGPIEVSGGFVGYNQIDGIICPAWEQGGHEQHNGVARVCRDLWPSEQRTEYLTYTRTRGRSRTVLNEHGNERAAQEVIPTPDMIARKHRALACYKSQMEVENCRDWFLGDLREYLALPPAQSGAKP